jgi:hypothetical protein
MTDRTIKPIDQPLTQGDKTRPEEWREPWDPRRLGNPVGHDGGLRNDGVVLVDHGDGSPTGLPASYVEQLCPLGVPRLLVAGPTEVRRLASSGCSA